MALTSKPGLCCRAINIDSAVCSAAHLVGKSLGNNSPEGLWGVRLAHRVDSGICHQSQCCLSGRVLSQITG